MAANLCLARLRVRRQVTEIRAHDFRFTTAETATFLEQELGNPADELAVKAIVEQSEGWVVSLRLMILSLRNRGALGLSKKPLSGQVAYVNDYPLCEAVTGLDDLECNGQAAYLEWLHQTNLFIIPLDDQRE